MVDYLIHGTIEYSLIVMRGKQICTISGRPCVFYEVQKHNIYWPVTIVAINILCFLNGDVEQIDDRYWHQKCVYHIFGEYCC